MSSEVGGTSLGLSGGLHLTVLGLMIFGLPALFQADPAPIPLPVEIVNFDDLTEVTELEAVNPVQEAPEVESKEPEPELVEPSQPAPPAPATPPTPAPAASRPQPSAPPPPAPQVADQPAAPVTPQVAELPQESPDPVQSQEAQPEEAPAAIPEQTAAVAPAPEPEPVKPPEVKEPEAEKDKPLMANVSVPAPRARPVAAAPKAQETSAVKVKATTPEPEKTQALDPLASVLRNVQRDLKPQAQQRQQEAAKTQAAEATSLDQRRKADQIKTLIQQQVHACWRIDAGASNAQDLIVPVRFRLQRDGRVIGQPEFQDMPSYLGNSFYRAAADNARRAILDCQPFNLPVEDYDIWKDLILNFNPAEMF
ncbi:hypothetical protein ACTL6U_06880 [Rhodovibrionaceae bacterium A322]